jgi:anaerobic magnesium-protoporphyrin IX monomethyl ester cyclase
MRTGTSGRAALPVVSSIGEGSAPRPPAKASPLSGLRVLLINPPQTYPHRLSAEYQSYWPLGLALIAAVLEQAGATVRCIDCLSYDRVSRRRVDGALRFGLADPELSEQIAAHDPHVVGITNPFTHFIEDTIWTAQRVKILDARIQVIVGGIEASIEESARRLLDRCPQIDVLVRGEGEETIVDVLSRYDVEQRTFTELDGVAGIIFCANGQVVMQPPRPFLKDLDTLPLPAYHLFDLDKMYANRFYALNRGRRSGVRCLPMHTSRGCPYSCSFCSVHSQVGKGHRRHSAEYVVRHIEFVKKRYGVTHFHFEDDNLTLNHAHALEMFRAIAAMNITWDTPNGTRADTITPELARAMRDSGAISIAIAVESGNQRVLDKIVNKRLDLSDVEAALTNLRDVGLPALVFFVVGFPGETEQDIRDTFRLARKFALAYAAASLIFVATPLPGTPLYSECAENGYFDRPIDNESLLASIRLNQTALIRTADFSKPDMFQWAQQELNTDALRTIGKHIPMLYANSADGVRNASTIIGHDLSRVALPGYWERTPEWAVASTSSRALMS